MSGIITKGANRSNLGSFEKSVTCHLENGDFVTPGDLQQFSEAVQMESVKLFSVHVSQS